MGGSIVGDFSFCHAYGVRCLFEVSCMAILATVDAVLHGNAWNGNPRFEMGFPDIDTLCVMLKARSWDGDAGVEHGRCLLEMTRGSRGGLEISPKLQSVPGRTC
jgi:hypothetical protein